MVDQQPVLEVLPGVGEGQPEQLGVAAGTVVRDGGDQTDEVSAERDDDRAEARVAPETGGLRGQVHAAGVPVLQRHQRQGRVVADADLDAAGVHGRADVVKDHDGLRERRHVDDDVAVRRGAGAGEAQHDRLGQLAVDLHQRALGEVAHRQRRGAVGRDEHGADQLVVGTDRLHDDTFGGADLDRQVAVDGGGPVVQALEAGERGEPPLLLATGDGSEGVRVARQDPLDARVGRLLRRGGLDVGRDRPLHDPAGLLQGSALCLQGARHRASQLSPPSGAR